MADEPDVLMDHASAEQPAHRLPAVRFVGVCFSDWLLDLERVLLLRALRGIAGDTRIDRSAPGTASPLPLLVVVEERRGVQEVVAFGDLMHAGDMTQDGEVAAIDPGIRIGMTLTQADSALPATGGRPAGARCRDAMATQLLESVGRLRADHVAGQASGLLAGRSWGDRIVSADERLIAVRSDSEICRRVFDRLGRCLERWIPVVGLPDPASGDPTLLSYAERRRPVLVGDFTGCASLFRRSFRGERDLMERMADNFQRRGFRVQVATASTIGAAVAVARWRRSQTRSPRAGRCIAVPSGAESRALADLPVESLRIPTEAVDALAEVGVETVGQLEKLGRAGVAARLSGQAEQAAGDTTLFGEVILPSRKSSRSSVRRSARAIHSGHRVRDALRRLDEAFGVVPERLEPFRREETLLWRHDFDGPCVHAEAIGVVCSGLLERAMQALHGRREALRRAMWIFHHAPLPHDLSTDRVRTSVPQEQDSRSGPGACADGLQSRIALAPVRPCASAAHLWGIFRASLERIALDHGVESIVCVVEQSVRRRVRQTSLALTSSRAPSCSASAPPACEGEAPTRHALSSRRSRDEWEDLVRSRLGACAVLSGSSLRELAASRSSDPAPVRADAARVDRPSIWFGRGEPALLRARGSSCGIAGAIARRTSWCSDAGRSDNASADGSAEAPRLLWRSHAWGVHAVDSWERRLPPWWGVQSETCMKDDGTQAEARHELAGGSVYSRLQVDPGLWLLVRWPVRLPSRPERRGAADPRPESASAMAERMLERMSISLIGSDDAWDGVGLVVLGAWG